MNFDIDPIAFHVGPLAVHWYGILIAAGLFAGLALALARSKKFAVNPEKLLDIILVGIPAGIIGGRLYYVIFNLDYYVKFPREIIATWHGGMAIHGVILFALLAVFIYCRIKKQKLLPVLDLCAPSLALGQCIGRWGNFVNKEAYGVATNLPWGININGVNHHPTFLYESIWDFGVMLTLLIISKRTGYRGDGRIFAVYLVIYSVGRFLIESLRTDSLMFFGFRTAQLVSLLMLAVGLVIYIKIAKKKNSI